MNRIVPMSFEEYENTLASCSKNSQLIIQESEVKEIGNYAVSPFSSGKGSEVSALTRCKVLDIAHPIDGTIVKALDNPCANAILSKLVQTGIDMNYGINLSTGIHVTPKTSPEMYAIIEKCAKELGLAIPYVIISNSIKGINACTCGTNQFAFVMISSLMPMIMKKDELCFVIGHELGHLAMGHALYHTAGQLIGMAGSYLPVVGNVISSTISFPLNAWSRRSEITADRAGLLCCKDLEAAKRALFRLETGLYNAKGVNIDEYIADSEAMLSSSHLGKLSEYTYSHPIISKRIKALEMFAKSEVYADAIGIPKTENMISREVLNSETERIIKVLDNPIN